MGIGRLEVITGCMFSGKTTDLLRRVAAAQKSGLATHIYKPLLDTRHMEPAVISHDGVRLAASWLGPDLDISSDTIPDVLALDEVQFFSLDVVPFVNCLVQHGVRVIVAGLDLTYKAEPFGPVPALCAYADEVLKLRARCNCCGQPASRSQRIVATSETILVGSTDSYEPRCTTCFNLILP